MGEGGLAKLAYRGVDEVEQAIDHGLSFIMVCLWGDGISDSEKLRGGFFGDFSKGSLHDEASMA